MDADHDDAAKDDECEKITEQAVKGYAEETSQIDRAKNGLRDVVKTIDHTVHDMIEMDNLDSKYKDSGLQITSPLHTTPRHGSSLPQMER